ncbi:MAG: ribose-5-phosphate isomerase RpiA [Proteobacteria bacterium]|nr:ribose-5-phosphate isomerase RpiA [Pseudomonadota bacterium]
MTDPVQEMKRAVGRAAADRVASGMVVGLGTGSTAVHAIARLGERLRSGQLDGIAGVATSFQSSVLAREHGIPLVALDQTDRIDIAIDGADEVAPNLCLIKGGGGAHTREKIVDALAETFVVVVDESKLVDRLGTVFPVPIEVVPMAVAAVMHAVESLGGRPELRMAEKKAGPVVTDQGNLLIDARFDAIDQPAQLERTLNNIPGVLDNGLFVDLADLVLVGAVADGVPSVREYRGESAT